MSESDLPRTALAAEHEALGAKMVPFSGWLMPVQYEGILAEHQQTRTRAGLFDLSHMGRLSFTGPDALALIQLAAVNDASRLRPGAAHYSLICHPTGGVMDDILVYRLDDSWRMVVNAGNRERVVPHLTALRDQERLDVEVLDHTLETILLGIQGPESLGVVAPLVQTDVEDLGYYRFVDTHLVSELGGAPVTVARSGYTGEDGFELTLSNDEGLKVWRLLLANDLVKPVGLGARDTLRLEAGMPLYGHELNDDVTPYEAQLGRVVKLDKGSFIGRDALADLADRTPERLLVGLGLASGAVPRQGNVVSSGPTAVGAIASGTFSPTLKRPIATAYVPPDSAIVDADLAVAIRDSQVPARVVSLPFVPHRTRARRAPSQA